MHSTKTSPARKSDKLNKEATASNRKTVQGKMPDLMQRPHQAGSATNTERHSTNTLDSSKNGLFGRRRSECGSGPDVSAGKKAGDAANIKRRKREMSADSESSASSSTSVQKTPSISCTRSVIFLCCFMLLVIQ